jgi:hypothetical protein
MTCRTLLILTAVSVLPSLPAFADDGNMMSKSATANGAVLAKKAMDHRMKGSPAKAKGAMMGARPAMNGMAHTGDAMKPAKPAQN